MHTKLTLNIDETVIAKAKVAAKRKNTSVSRLVEKFLIQLSVERELNIVDLIKKNAPKKKTIPGTEKKILTNKLKKKYGA